MVRWLNEVSRRSFQMLRNGLQTLLRRGSGPRCAPLPVRAREIDASTLLSMTGVTCCRCEIEIQTWDGALGLVAHGFGDRGLIDTFGGEIELAFCAECAREMLEREPWLAPAFEVLNINYGHRCTDGEIHWKPMPKCELDPDKHGWREVWEVRPASSVRVPDRAPFTTQDGELVSFGVFGTEAEATAACAVLVAEGCDAKVSRSLLGNVEHHTVVEWRDFWPAWRERNRKHVQRQRVQRMNAVVLKPLWRLRQMARTKLVKRCEECSGFQH
jgi:hypothetical protein